MVNRWGLRIRGTKGSKSLFYEIPSGIPWKKGGRPARPPSEDTRRGCGRTFGELALRNGQSHVRVDFRKDRRNAVGDGREGGHPRDSDKAGQEGVFDEILAMGIFPEPESPDFVVNVSHKQFSLTAIIPSSRYI